MVSTNRANDEQDCERKSLKDKKKKRHRRKLQDATKIPVGIKARGRVGTILLASPCVIRKARCGSDFSAAVKHLTVASIPC
jgi:hypothetical protein